MAVGWSNKFRLGCKLYSGTKRFEVVNGFKLKFLLQLLAYIVIPFFSVKEEIWTLDDGSATREP